MAGVIEDPEDVGRVSGGLAGFLFGFKAGAFLPIPLVGSFVVGVLGAIIGSEVGGPIGRIVQSGAKSVTGK